VEDTAADHEPARGAIHLPDAGDDSCQCKRRPHHDAGRAVAPDDGDAATSAFGEEIPRRVRHRSSEEKTECGDVHDANRIMWRLRARFGRPGAH
jgi:hypothetical protein